MRARAPRLSVGTRARTVERRNLGRKDALGRQAIAAVFARSESSPVLAQATARLRFADAPATRTERIAVAVGGQRLRRAVKELVEDEQGIRGHRACLVEGATCPPAIEAHDTASVVASVETQVARTTANGWGRTVGAGIPLLDDEAHDRAAIRITLDATVARGTAYAALSRWGSHPLGRRAGQASDDDHEIRRGGSEDVQGTGHATVNDSGKADVERSFDMTRVGRRASPDAPLGFTSRKGSACSDGAPRWREAAQAGEARLRVEARPQGRAGRPARSVQQLLSELPNRHGAATSVRGAARP